MLSISIICDETQAAEFFPVRSDHAARYCIMSLPVNGIDLIYKSVNYAPDVIFLDISGDENTVLDQIAILSNSFPTSEIIIVLKSAALKSVRHFLAAGAIGFVAYPLTPDKIAVVINILESGGSPIDPKLLHSYFDIDAHAVSDKTLNILTARENEIVTAISAGLSYKMVADRLHISLETVRHHIKNIYRKMKINSKGELLNKVFTEAERL